MQDTATRVTYLYVYALPDCALSIAGGLIQLATEHESSPAVLAHSIVRSAALITDRHHRQLHRPTAFCPTTFLHRKTYKLQGGIKHGQE